MDSGHYYCYVLDQNIEKWCRCDDETTTKFRGYPNNVYHKLLHESEHNMGKINTMKVSDRIVSMLCIKIYILTSSTYSFNIEESVSDDIEILKKS